MNLPEELRLACAIVLNALVLAASWRVARRFTNDKLAAAVDAGLLFYLVQYVTIGALGLVGLLTPVWIFVVGSSISIVMFAASWKSISAADGRGFTGWESWTTAIVAMFAIAFVGAFVFNQRLLPVMANDAMTYHVPAAVQWLQHHRIDRFDVWLFNPANTYSPLAGSMFIGWLIAPMGSDMLARFVETPALILTGLATARICRSIGGSTVVATMVAAVLVLSRPFLSQAPMAKDDLFVAAFFACAVAGSSKDRFAGWRVGIALGLLLATKYTVFFSLPILLLAVDQMQWKSWIVALVIAILLAGPWYLRNILWTGNPLFPSDFLFFRGLFSPAWSEKLQSARNVIRVFTVGNFALPVVPAILVTIGWLAAAAVAKSKVKTDPLVRLVIIGPLVGLFLFALRSPYPEVRFVLPSFVLMFTACGLAIEKTSNAKIIGGLILVASVLLTTFQPHLLPIVGELATYAAGITLIVASLVVLQNKVIHLKQPFITASIILVALLGVATYVYWPWYSEHVHLQAVPNWQVYGEESAAWEYVREELPDDARLAYANTYFVYPLYGPNLNRRVTYVPVRADLPDFLHLPRLGDRLSGEELSRAVVKATMANPDRNSWMISLEKSGSTHLFISKHDAMPDPPELKFVESAPDRFEKLYENAAAAVYRIKW